MHSEHPHPLLAQLPLTVSPFLSLPTAVPLPYSYKSVPSTLPPSVTDAEPPHSPPPHDPTPPGSDAPQRLAQYVVSPATGHAAHPSAIAASGVALRELLVKRVEDAAKEIAAWEESIKERELAEKRRVAPGWLDVGEGNRILVPVRVGGKEAEKEAEKEAPVEKGADEESKAGDELDRAFGKMGV
ncbi:hypothetical protein EJ06DRAFT_554648 [Trichodelitschia bisporula]|uniref:Uncharacterized protein n=1 Tax=Trichodelitschia bisporula TaxID=703511 RepID=A0A6G1I4C2_9PEZI|nr:hypothetical protein EJ06DRAFT_554648 [Trichodelitschia bisporula]